MLKFYYLLLTSLLMAACSGSKPQTLWSIGVADGSAAELAMGGEDYKKFLANDFGYEDRYFLIGHSTDSLDFPYVLPGPADEWGGTWSTSGWRTHDINILFGIDEMPKSGDWKLVIDLVDNAVKNPPLIKVNINSQTERLRMPSGGSDSSLVGKLDSARRQTVEIAIGTDIIKRGGNCINIGILEGSWAVFDDIRLVGPAAARLAKPDKAFVRNVEAAEYEFGSVQPLLVDVEHLSGSPTISVELDGDKIFEKVVDSARYIFEAPMPAVIDYTTSFYKILCDGRVIDDGYITRSERPEQTAADYVDTKIGTAHSRWMIAPGPWMPFSMVKISPDNQNAGWQAGYQPTFESVGCFSHIHEWTMGGLGLMPTTGPLKTTVGDEFDPESGYRSRIDKASEEAPIGYYKVHLDDYGIDAEMTATTRCSFSRYTFPDGADTSRVIIDLQIPTEYNYNLVDAQIRKVSDYKLEGYSHQLSPDAWDRGINQEYTIHFVIEFDQPIKDMGGWKNGTVVSGPEISGKGLERMGAYATFDAKTVQVRTGISLVSVDNAADNLITEITYPFAWDFEAIRNNQRNVWNELFSRLDIKTDDRMEKVRFYTNMYRALCSRNIWSDANGQWVSADEKVRTFADKNDVALGCDAFWNTFWNLNQMWNLVTPEWSSKWVKSQLAMYDANGWLAKGPAGMEYIPVMVAEHEIPLIVGAYQMGIRDYDAEKAFAAVKKMQTTPGQSVAGGYAGNRDLEAYLKYKFVPEDKGRFSNSLEYSYDDWTVSQFAKALGKEADYKVFADRGTWWRNVIEPTGGYAHLRSSDGKFVDNFDPFQSGRNHHYVEGNAWQLTFFVPQDVPALAEAIGKDRFIERLDWGFGTSYAWRFNAPNDQYWDYPVMQGNQQSMHFAFLFNWVGRPWLTQKWSRAIVERYYGTGSANAYLGDEDQGQMSAWLVMASLGLFQTDGGCRTEPIYEIGSPLYEKVTIDLGERYGRGKTFSIEAKNASRRNVYVQSATLNGQKLTTFHFPAAELLKGGSLVLEMGDKPNVNWGVE